MQTSFKIGVAVVAVLLLAGCGRGLETGECQETFEGRATATCELDDWGERSYDLVLPDDYDSDVAVPLVVALHGGGGSSDAAAGTTCPNGNTDHEECLHNYGRERGFAVAYPNGTPSRLAKNVRTWNAGGGEDNWRCTSGRACEDGVDDIAYLNDLLDDIESRVNVDTDRVYFTGLSNGAAMSYAAACEMSDRVAAIVPVGGAMQWTTTNACEPDRPVPVMHIHGTEDPAWKYGGDASDAVDDQGDTEHVSVERTLAEWEAINGCGSEVRSEDLPNPNVVDGSKTTRMEWRPCDAPLVHMKIVGGGHTWPNGHQYFSRGRIGPTSRDWGNEVIWEFMSQQSLP
jgi:polyhydroxybutyrate depolymerase